VINIDIYPTLVELAGINDPLNDSPDGLSIVPLLLGKGSFNADRPIFWHFPVYLQAYSQELDDGRDSLFRTRPGSAIRYGQWKLHEYFEDGALELYNLAEDISERNNLADERPERTMELYQMLTEWRDKTAAPVPTEPNPEYVPSNLTEE
jgi:arylsulfatase A-like enzyme